MMNRRSFAAGITAAAGTAFLTERSFANQQDGSTFKLNYAPAFRHFGNSAGKDPIDQIKFIHDSGFRAIEDNPMMSRPVELQRKIGDQLVKLDMTMGVFVLGFGMMSYMMTSNHTGDGMRGKPDVKAVRAELKKACLQGIETAKRVNAKWCTVVLGAHNPHLNDSYQFANVVDNLKFCSELLEPHGLVMVMEPLNHVNHPGVYLRTVPQAYAICKAVGSPSCKILNDLYHQQIEIGNLIKNIDDAWDETAYFQVGDVPGRKEPTTGEINYKNVFKHLYQKGYQGIVGMEHGISLPGIEGEKRLIQAYREVDSFDAE